MGMGRGDGEGGREGWREGKKGRKLGEKSPDLLGHPQVPAFTWKWAQGPQDKPPPQPCKPQTLWRCPTLGSSCPRNDPTEQLLQLELGLEFCRREEGAAACPIPGH